METMYKEEILELYAEKPNFGELKGKTHEVKLKNPLCKDEIKIQLKIKNKKIIDAKFTGITCFVSTISAIKLLEEIKGKTLEEVKKLSQKDLDKILGIKIIPTRIGCQMMPLEALKKLK